MLHSTFGHDNHFEFFLEVIQGLYRDINNINMCTLDLWVQCELGEVVLHLLEVFIDTDQVSVARKHCATASPKAAGYAEDSVMISLFPVYFAPWDFANLAVGNGCVWRR